MVKRFHDTEIWKQDWFLEIDNEYRTLWLYIKDTCDHAGIWKPEKKFVEFITGKPMNLQTALQAFNKDKERVKVLENGRWLLPDFVTFQYGHTLNPENRVHLSILKLLDVNGVNLTSIRGLLDPNDRPKDKDKVKDNVSSKDVRESSREGSEEQEEWFGMIWEDYPQKGRVGKKLAYKYFCSSVKDYATAKRCAEALDKYRESDRVNRGYIQNATTFFNNWQDWETYENGSTGS